MTTSPTLRRGWLAGAALLASVAPAIAQTPAPATPLQSRPQITLPWLASVKVEGTPTPGTELRGTVTLLRVATADMKVGLVLQPGMFVEGGVWHSQDVSMDSSATVRRGQTQGHFRVRLVSVNAPPEAKTYTVTAMHNGEQRSTTFTLSR